MMAMQDILPITSISLIVVGFIIILIGLIWMAKAMSKAESTTGFSNAEEIIGEMNQMFTYFTDQIDSRDKNPNPRMEITDTRYILEDKRYRDVLELKNQGKTPDEIARALKLGKGEINLILGIDQMR